MPTVLIDILLHDKEAENTAQNARRLWSRHIMMAQTYVTRALWVEKSGRPAVAREVLDLEER